MKKALFVLLLIIIPLANAFECETTTDKNYCEIIQSSSLSEVDKDSFYSALLYTNHSEPDHRFIEDYNLNVIVNDSPFDAEVKSSKYIKNAWVSIFSVFPSVYENTTLYVPNKINVLSSYDYEIDLPNDYSGSYPDTSNGDCARTYDLVKNEYRFKQSFNDELKSSNKLIEVDVNIDGQLKAELSIETEVKISQYHWKRYCCVRGKDGCKEYCHKCDQYKTSYETDNVEVEETKDITLYIKDPSIKINFLDSYYNTTKGNFTASDYTSFIINFPKSYVKNNLYRYEVIFEKKPLYFAYLKAKEINQTTHKNLYLSDNTFFVNNASYCNYVIQDYFSKTEGFVNVEVERQELKKLETEERNFKIALLFKILILIGICYVVYVILRSKFKKVGIFVLLILICLPTVLAEEECGLTNLASCIPEKMYEYFIHILNLPLAPLLGTVSSLLTANPSTNIFYHLWAIMRYIISFFYVFIFIYAGYIFLTSNANPIKRAQAKELLKNTFIMIVLIQGSFYLYDLILYLSSVMNSTIIGMIDPHFFMLTADNLLNIGLELVFSGTYLIVLLFTVILLTLRFMLVSFGVVLLPLSIFCYFLPPLKQYGKFLLHLLGSFIFVTFLDLLIILGCSMLINVPLFENFKIVVMIVCFILVDYTLILLIKFAMNGASNNPIKEDLGQAMKYVALLV